MTSAAGKRHAILLSITLIVVVGLFLAQAWMVDDAYITLRTVDNLVHRHGLTWNVAERVQVYTHPLWMLMLAALYAVTREAFLTPLALSLAFLVALLVHVRAALRDEPWRFYLFAMMLVASKAFFDFTSSGLENPATNLLVALFYTSYLRDEPGPRRATWLYFVAALAFVNRADTLLLFLPALVMELLPALADRTRLRGIALATSPAIAWLGFSVLYYGFPFPNTAYAKALENGLSLSDALGAGVNFFRNSLQWDPPTLLVMAAAAALAVVGRRRADLVGALGILAYLGYVLVLGAASTHMSGRFFSGPFVLGALLLARSMPRLAAWPALTATAAAIVLSPGSPLLSSLSTRVLGREGHGAGGLIDTRYFVHLEGAALIAWRPGHKLLEHGWYVAGREFRRSREKVHVGGAWGGLPIGYFGFGAGPSKFIIDPLGLSDPLLARLPMSWKWSWYPGHFLREVPDGYVESVASGEDRLSDPDLRRIYDDLLLITRGPLLSFERMQAIARANTGGLRPSVEAYARRMSRPARMAKDP